MKGFIRAAAVIVAASVMGAAAAAAEDEAAEIFWENDVTLEWISHNLEPGWQAVDDGLNKAFHYQTGTSTNNPTDWKTDAGQRYDLRLGIRPLSGMYGEIGCEFLGNHADRYWQPIQDGLRMERDAVHTRWTRGLLRYETDWFTGELFRGVGQPGWLYSGDMFGLYPEHFELGRYRRVGGSILPRGGKLRLALPYGILQVVAGDELRWGYGPSIYTSYDFRACGTHTTLFHKREGISYGDPQEKLDAWEAVTRCKVLPAVRLEAGLLYQPFRIGGAYTAVETVAPGSGLEGSGYTFSQRTADQYDAFGENIDLYVRVKPVVDEIVLGATHAGRVAGNKNELRVSGRRRFGQSFRGALGYTYRTPYEDPLPLLYEGTADNPGALLSSPRGADAPFRVYGGQYGEGNREARIITLALQYDPTPRTGLYRWKQDVVEYWNINTGEDASVASGLQLQFTDYPGSTDRNYYYDETGSVVYEPSFQAGMPPLRRFLPSVQSITVINLRPHNLIIELGGGESVASTVLAQEYDRIVTNYFKGTLRYSVGWMEASVSYARDYWGPEDFHRDFGQIIDSLYAVGLVYRIHDETSLFARYYAARRDTNLADGISLGSFNEVHVGMTLHFGARLLFAERQPDSGDLRARLQRGRPQIGVSLLTKTFTPGEGETMPIFLDVFAGVIKSWDIVILDERQRAVGSHSGVGMPPDIFQWDGIDKEFEQTLPDGRYEIYFQATDYYNRAVLSDPVYAHIAY